jgi:2',3'-cyclic-nucleotide 2'-phosphodiesterase (5'-nucleotidase family)
MRKSFRQSVLATAAVIGLSTLAFAATAAPPAAGNPTVVAPAASAKPAVHQSQQSTVDQRILDLHAKLQITAAQQTQWEPFAQVMRANATGIDEAFQTRVKALPGMTAADNVKSYAVITEEHAKEMQKLVPVFQTLYDTMSDSQKHVADQVFRADAKNGAPARRS